MILSGKGSLCDDGREGQTTRLVAWRNQDAAFSQTARLEAGYLLRLLQQGESLGLPHSRPMPAIGLRCHELRINDEAGTFRVIYRADTDAMAILDVFLKKTPQTPQSVIAACKRRLREYDRIDEAGE